jgi:hypothetical protein
LPASADSPTGEKEKKLESLEKGVGRSRKASGDGK